ncbi:ANTAR domain-containing response regulator [Eubacterium uniforme]|uniref:Response regulator NasT n=1 Tax=Eubacterium uniforme TaxID=39495 RepID=A0A1T4VHE7_9FIRM|nr:ANTAR domain-containing protein [Eubacterium uniforme]SKA64374.1 response regulator NasT [Eubacterium uniforme]HAH18494.1 ANTAR domain-containing protein [Eubacterium sp.]HAV91547.1 ANTAR domain-containing protein [Eubacterium sp.]
MAGIIVAFSKPEEGRTIKNLLVRNGYTVAAVCTSGAQVINMADSLRNGVVVCGYKLADMICTEVWEHVHEDFEMVLLTNPGNMYEFDKMGIATLSMPLKVKDLVNTVEMSYSISERRWKKKKLRPKPRSEEDKKIIEEAKSALIEINNMTENEAHRYIQKKSMNTGSSFAETAKLILESLYRE